MTPCSSDVWLNHGPINADTYNKVVRLGKPELIVQAAERFFDGGERLLFDDGVETHRGHCTVLKVNPTSILVQFDDRADTTLIYFARHMAWMRYLTVV